MRFLACIKADIPPVVKESTEHPCLFCKEQVWVSPRGRQEADSLGLFIVCMTCAIDKVDGVFAPLTESQKEGLSEEDLKRYEDYRVMAQELNDLAHGRGGS